MPYFDKSKGFTLRSGNKTSYKEMGSEDSPLDVNNFGVGEGTSPYRQDEGKGSGWKKAAGIFGAALTSGLDAVYGTGKVLPSGSMRLKKDNGEDNGNDNGNDDE